MMMTKDIANPFTFVNDIFLAQTDIIRNSDNPKLTETFYSPYITNKALSFHLDSIFYANQMNQHHQLDKLLQYDYFLNSIRSFKRQHAWIKHIKDDDLELISEYYKINIDRAKEYLKILTKENIDTIRKIVSGE